MSDLSNASTTEQSLSSSVTSFTTDGGATSEATSTAGPEFTTTAAETAVDAEKGAILWAGVKPEYIIIPCILLGIPMLVLVYCMIKAVVSKDEDAEAELLKKAKSPSDEKDAASPARRKKSRRDADKLNVDGKKTNKKYDRNSVSPTDMS